MNPGNAADEKLTHRSNRVGWVVLFLLLLGEYGLFRQFAEREVTWAPPLMHDQVIYLVRSYQIYEAILRDGPVQGVWYGLRELTPNGVMLSLQAALLYVVLGASRLSALTLNFGYFAALQLTLAGTLRWLRGWSAAFLGVGLVLAAHAPFYWAGGLMDFRIDSTAMCLYGMVLCLAVRSELFASWRWAALCGGVASLLGLFRFISTLYLGALGTSFALVLLARLCLRRYSAELRRRTLQQLVGVTIVGTICAVCCGPFLWHNRQALHDYYFVGTIAGAEKAVRQREFGIFTQADALLYYPRSVGRDHTGLPFWLVSMAIMTGTTVLAAGRAVLNRWRPTPAALPAGPRLDLFSAYVALGLSLLIPLTILTAIPSKSPVVGSILVGPVVWLVVLSVIALGGFDRGRLPRLGSAVAALFAVVALGTGLWVQLTNLVPRGWMSHDRPELQQAAALLEQIGQDCKAAGWGFPRISATNTNHAMSPLNAEVLAYEKQGILLHATVPMPTSVLAVDEAQATSALAHSDFVILTRCRWAEASPYPFLQSMDTLRPCLRKLCDESFWPVGDYCVYGEEVTLYRRPCLRVEGNELDGRFAEEALVLHGTCAELRRFPHLVLSGHLVQAVPLPGPHVEAQLRAGRDGPRTLPATLTLSGDAYSVQVDALAATLPAEGEATLRLLFNAAPNTPHPVLCKPVTVKLTPEACAGATAHDQVQGEDHERIPAGNDRPECRLVQGQ